MMSEKLPLKNPRGVNLRAHYNAEILHFQPFTRHFEKLRHIVAIFYERHYILIKAENKKSEKPTVSRFFYTIFQIS